MKKLPKPILLSLLLLLLGGCDKEENCNLTIEDQPNDFVIVFLDNSLTSDSQSEQYLPQLQQFLVETMDFHGDWLAGYFLDGNSGGAVSFQKNAINAPPPAHPCQSGLTSAREILDHWQNQIRLQRRDAVDKLAAAFHTPHPKSTHQTDLWSTLERMSKFFASADSADRKHVFFVSDMTGAGRRDFTSRPPKNKAEAERWAEADAAWIKANLSVDPTALQGAVVHMLLPETAMEDSHVQPVRYYWEKLWGEMGMGE